MPGTSKDGPAVDPQSPLLGAVSFVGGFAVFTLTALSMALVNRVPVQ
jgi:hypothetical protein